MKELRAWRQEDGFAPEMNDLAAAVAVHLLSILHWIGGLSFVTTVILPLALMKAKNGEDGLALFEASEMRFSKQVRVSLALAGVSGLWMAYRLKLWARFLEPASWWLAAMVIVWVAFALLLFVLEPLMKRRVEVAGRRDPAGALRKLLAMHAVLLAMSILTVLGAAAGAHGFSF